VVNLQAGTVDPLVLNITNTNVTNVESRGEFAGLIQTPSAKVFFFFLTFCFVHMFICL
jgi:hypothetical protein